MSPVEAQALIDGWVRAELDRDLEARLGSPTQSQLDQLFQRHKETLGSSFANKAENDPRDAKPPLDELLKLQGLTLGGRDYQMATGLMIRAQFDLFRALTLRHSKGWRPWLEDDPAGGLLSTLSEADASSQEPASPPEPRSQGKLSEIAEAAIRELARQEKFAPKRVADYQNAVDTFILFLEQDPDVAELTPASAGRFMRDLAYYPSNVTKRKPYSSMTTFAERVKASKEAKEPKVLNPTTINSKYLTPLRRIIDWQRAESADLANPFHNITASKPRRPDRENQRRIFSDAEVVRLLELPVFVGAASRAGKGLHQPGPEKVGGWRFWVPLICLFSGMRLNEACGLTVADIRNSEGIHFFQVSDQAPGQRIKSEAARRRVPIHDGLLEIGFLDFVESLKELGESRLFPDLAVDESGYYSAKASKFFGKLIDSIADDKPDYPGKLVFHSARHTVVTHLRAAEVRTDVSKELVGHEQNDTHGLYGVSTLSTLQKAVNRISYRGLDLSRLVASGDVNQG